MKYQLVLQFTGAASLALDDLISLEDELSGQVPAGVVVDGHDIGAGEANIFIWTSDPVNTLAAIAPVLRSRAGLEEMGAAYRAERSDEYLRVWPPGSNAPFIVQ